MTHRNSSKSDPLAQICILWHSSEATPSDQLLAVLDTRGFSISPTTSMHQAFAGACSSSKSARRVVLVLDDRKALVGVDRVLDGLERFAPDVICWEHRVGQNPPMVPVVRVEVARQTTHSVEPVSSKAATNKLRLVCDESDSVQESVKAPKISLPKKKSGALSSSDVLDADELDALLAGEFSEGRRGKK